MSECVSELDPQCQKKARRGKKKNIKEGDWLDDEDEEEEY